MSEFVIVGAGMAGLLAAAMLRDECKAVWEAQPELPNNHSALLRFRSSIVGDALNIPFRRVKVVKAVVGSFGNPVGDMLAYSLKTNGSATLRSVVSANGEVEERFIAPTDLVQRMSRKLVAPINFDYPVSWEKPFQSPTISTIPMPALMKALGYEHKQEFKSVIGYNVNIRLHNVDVCATLYYPDPDLAHYRASITGDLLTIEFAFPDHTEDQAAARMRKLVDQPFVQRDTITEVLRDFGITNPAWNGKPVVSKQRYAKILPIDENERKRFILWASEKHNIYSLGRFATWRPGLLLDDVVKDVRVIQSIARNGSYDHRKG